MDKRLIYFLTGGIVLGTSYTTEMYAQLCDDCACYCGCPADACGGQNSEAQLLCNLSCAGDQTRDDFRQSK